MSKGKGSVATGAMSAESPSVTQERILRVLDITQRPLQSGELANALAMFSGEANGACQWLTDKGYITGKGSQRATSWALADKGRMWVKGQHQRPTQGH
jgi:hypothetical protein